MSDHFPVTVVSARRLAFEPDVEADHRGKIPGGILQTYVTPPPSGYTVSPGRTVILAPFKWYIPDSATYEWSVDGAPQGSTTEYLSFAYNAFGAGNHTVTVTAKINGSPVASATTTVSCVAGAAQRQPGSGSNPVSEKLFSVVAPGQFGDGSGRLGSWNGFGGFGGYAVFKFDHSVPKNGLDAKEIKVGGNTGPWTEPGAIWLSMDENRDGEPNDTWYEAQGSHTFADDTVRRYAVTFRDDYTWTDNLGGGGTYPTLQGYSGTGPELTFTGTRLDKRLVGMSGVWGYADVYDDQKVSISNAIQVDGTPADLPFVDFVKIVTAVHHGYDDLGEISTEAGTPMDVNIGDPEMLMLGKYLGENEYNYVFVNESGYGLAIVFETSEISLPSKEGGTPTTRYTITPSASVYIDFRGGNVALEFRDNDRHTAYFVDGPAE
jgi:hypothetical protein